MTSLRRKAVALAEGLGCLPTAGAVLPMVLGGAAAALAAQQACEQQGVRVGCFRPPSVPAGRSCLRLTARADLTELDVARAVQVVRSVLRSGPA